MSKLFIVLFFIIILLVSSCAASDPVKDEFAKCLTENGAKFYGAFWCPHCAEQKKLFGGSIEYVDYIECSTPDRRGQTAVCQQAGIESYPTWIFNDGSRLDGVLSMETLSEKTGCSLTHEVLQENIS